MARWVCPGKANNGSPCGYWSGPCPYHPGSRRVDTPRQPKAKAQPAPGPLELPAAVEEHNLHGLGWWLVERVTRDAIDLQRAGVLISLIRALAGLGPEPMAREDALREVELLGAVSHGLPPRSPDEWERAERLFSSEGLAEIARWHAYGSADELRQAMPFRNNDDLIGLEG